MSRRARGRTAHQDGAAAEDIAARTYEAGGARVLERRWRGPEGELDLVVLDGPVLVFVEVKKRSGPVADDPVTPAQWRRLEQTALRYMMLHTNQTGTAPGCRFDVVLVGQDGTAEVIENARTFDEQ